jgi:uncharacterized protein YndB with AHSA1/START domain
MTTAPIVEEIVVHATPERIFSLLTRPEELVRWWPDVASFDARVGGEVRFGWAGGAEVTGRVTRFDPPRALAFSWTPDDRSDARTAVEFTVTDLGAGSCRVTVVHSGWETAPELRPRHHAGWRHFLGCLADLAAGRSYDKAFVPTS